MQAINYKVKGEERRGIDAQSLLMDMKDAEEFNGTTEAKIYEAWYELKRRVAEIVMAEPEPKEEEKAAQ